ncbi:MAG: DUF4440 domain-containing protein [Prolixibacteraceae bacterium]|jgi:ketosteroid isomerase-like protein|nr:DUF4440 domain-containing protein [Prolixibacteraceae bacterium]
MTIQEKITGLEKTALAQWNHGNPAGFIELSAKDVTYFDPLIEKRLDGLDALIKLYEPAKGQIKVDRYEMVNPLVQATNEMAVLTYNLHSFVGDKVYKWNCTEVFRLETDGEWKIIHTHWSLTKPALK